MNIVAESAVLGIRFWFCIDGGYNVANKFYIFTRKLGTNGPDEHICCRNQTEMAGQIMAIGEQIRIKAQEYVEYCRQSEILD